MIIDGKRSLAHVEKVAWVKPIEGADNIEVIGVLGWVCIAKIGEFKKGSLKIATKAKDVPVVPLTIEGTYNALEKNGLNSAKVKLVIDKPIYIKDYSKEQLNELAKQCYDIIKSNHDKM